jgi:hypothetical protein
MVNKENQAPATTAATSTDVTLSTADASSSSFYLPLGPAYPDVIVSPGTTNRRRPRLEQQQRQTTSAISAAMEQTAIAGKATSSLLNEYEDCLLLVARAAYLPTNVEINFQLPPPSHKVVCCSYHFQFS